MIFFSFYFSNFIARDFLLYKMIQNCIYKCGVYIRHQSWFTICAVSHIIAANELYLLYIYKFCVYTYSGQNLIRALSERESRSFGFWQIVWIWRRSTRRGYIYVCVCVCILKHTHTRKRCWGTSAICNFYAMLLLLLWVYLSLTLSLAGVLHFRPGYWSCQAANFYSALASQRVYAVYTAAATKYTPSPITARLFRYRARI